MSSAISGFMKNLVSLVGVFSLLIAFPIRGEAHKRASRNLRLIVTNKKERKLQVTVKKTKTRLLSVEAFAAKTRNYRKQIVSKRLSQEESGSISAGKRKAKWEPTRVSFIRTNGRLKEGNLRDLEVHVELDGTLKLGFGIVGHAFNHGGPPKGFYRSSFELIKKMNLGKLVLDQLNPYPNGFPNVIEQEIEAWELLPNFSAPSDYLSGGGLHLYRFHFDIPWNGTEQTLKIGSDSIEISSYKS